MPTFKETGLGGWLAPAFWALIAPPGTPEDIRQVVYDTFADLYKDPAYVESLTDMGMEPRMMTTEEFKEFLADWHKVGASLIEMAGIEPVPFEPK